MTCDGQLQIFRRDAPAIILYTDAALPPIFKANINLVGLGVQAVFHQFFQHAGGPFNHLAGGDLVAQLGWQQAYMTIFFRHGFSVCAHVRHGKRRRRPGKNTPARRRRACLAARGAYVWKARLKRRDAKNTHVKAARRMLREETMHDNIMKAIAEPLRGPLSPKGYDPELLYVECGRCGSPVMWEQGKATDILGVAGIDPLELDSSCLLVTDACPLCGGKGHYTVQIFRVSGDTQTRRPPYFGNA